MNNKKIKESLDKLIQNKKIFNLVCLALAIAFILLTISILNSGSSKESDVLSNDVANNNGQATTTKELTYEETQRKELIDILSKMKGVGEVDVKMHFATSEVKVPAKDNNKQTSVTEESDKQGGTRVNNSETDNSTVVMQSEGGESKPVFLQVNKPEVTGVVIVAEGATSEKVKYEIQTAVSKLYNLSVDKVNVMPMESSNKNN
ncbi:MAG: stage III sporulation protein AG [Clostridium sp.]